MTPPPSLNVYLKAGNMVETRVGTPTATSCQQIEPLTNVGPTIDCYLGNETVQHFQKGFAENPCYGHNDRKCYYEKLNRKTIKITNNIEEDFANYFF